jgi:hypothetical protein
MVFAVYKKRAVHAGKNWPWASLSRLAQLAGKTGDARASIQSEGCPLSGLNIIRGELEAQRASTVGAFGLTVGDYLDLARSFSTATEQRRRPREDLRQESGISAGLLPFLGAYNSAMRKLTTGFDLTRLTPENIKNLLDEENDLSRFLAAVNSFSRRVPAGLSIEERMRRLRREADAVLGAWNEYHRKLPKFAREAIVEKALEKIPEKLAANYGRNHCDPPSWRSSGSLPRAADRRRSQDVQGTPGAIPVSQSCPESSRPQHWLCIRSAMVATCLGHACFVALQKNRDEGHPPSLPLLHTCGR